MKKSLLLLTFILLGYIITFAQNYQTVYPDKIALFVSDGIIYPLYVDKVKIGDDWYLYPNQVLEPYDEWWELKYTNFWAGEKIIIKSDGTNIYFNKLNDSIIIKTHAKLNEKWIAFQPKFGSTVIEAKVASIENKIILGQADSVKTIEFKILEIKESLYDLLDLRPISISKSFGWVETAYFNTFPEDFYDFSENFFDRILLVGVNQPTLGIQNLTTFDIFDFQPGNIIQTMEKIKDPFDIDPLKTKITRTSDLYLKRTDYPDSIEYLIQKEIHINCIYNDSTIFKTSIDTIIQIIKPDTILDKLPGEVREITTPTFSSLTQQLTYNYLINNRSSKIVRSCYTWGEYVYFGTDNVRYIYIEGLGGPYYSMECCPDYSYHITYYKKGTETWGTPFDFSGVESFSSNNSIQVFPNPASDKICIEVTELKNPLLFELITIDGRTLIQQLISSSGQEINISGFQKGNYIYRVTDGSQLKKSGKLSIN